MLLFDREILINVAPCKLLRQLINNINNAHAPTYTPAKYNDLYPDPSPSHLPLIDM